MIIVVQVHCITDLGLSPFFQPLDMILVPDSISSNWPSNKTRMMFRPMPGVPAEIEANMKVICVERTCFVLLLLPLLTLLARRKKVVDFVGYAPNALNWRLNQVQYPMAAIGLRSASKLKVYIHRVLDCRFRGLNLVSFAHWLLHIC